MNSVLMCVANRFRDELAKTAAVAFVSSSAAAAGQIAAHWAVNRFQQNSVDKAAPEEEDKENKENSVEIEQTT